MIDKISFIDIFFAKGLEPNDADNDPYSRLIPRERVHVGSAESEGEEEIDGDETPRNVSLSGPTTGVCVYVCVVCVCVRVCVCTVY